jgi:hypothetical protein
MRLIPPLRGHQIRVALGLTILPLVISSLAGCAGAMRSYNAESTSVLEHVRQGNVNQALATLEAQNTSDDKDLLYFLEKGELTRLRNDYLNSKASLLQADEKIRLWEEESKTNPDQLMGLIGSVIVNDKVRRYDGQDYEKVMASTRLAMTHLALGDLASARTEIKKTHEREAIIQEYRDKEYAKVEEEAKEKGQQATFKDLKGYPVETLEDPEVLALKNGYQNAFSHYLAGFVYESLGEPSLAAPGYRKAIELRPNVKLLEEGLSQLEQRMANKNDGLADTLFVIETGTIPGRESVTVPLPIPTASGLVVAPISFPVIRSTREGTQNLGLRTSSTAIDLAEAVNFDAMARRCLRDEMPGIILRSTIRGALKGTLQHEINKRAGLVGGLLTAAVNVATEQADERAWRSLPNRVYLARARLAPGLQDVILQVDGIQRNVKVDLKPGPQLVNLRLAGNQLLLVQPNTPYIEPKDNTALAKNTPPAANQEHQQ